MSEVIICCEKCGCRNEKAERMIKHLEGRLDLEKELFSILEEKIEEKFFKKTWLERLLGL